MCLYRRGAPIASGIGDLAVTEDGDGIRVEISDGVGGMLWRSVAFVSQQNVAVARASLHSGATAVRCPARVSQWRMGRPEGSSGGAEDGEASARSTPSGSLVVRVTAGDVAAEVTVERSDLDSTRPLERSCA